MAITNVTDANFDEEVTKSEKPVLLDAWATWCQPCVALSPILESIATSEKFKDKIMVKKLNADENPTTAGNLGIRGLPTMMIFKNGECVGTKVGLVSENVISDWIDDTLV
tara:strand:- start:46 stop:375 length:330 start_codon:yes stop_codon:yes gene_type:complete